MAELIKTNKKYFGLGQVPIGIGAIMKGWDISEEDFRNPSILPVVDFRAMTATCFHDCFHCFTDKNKRTLSLGTIKRVIGEIAQMGARGIDFLGEGEPTLDKNFFEIVEFTQAQGIIPIVFTDGATKLEDKNFIKRLKDSGCSVCPKCDSLFNPEYQNWVVGDKTNRYFERRNEVVKLLMEAGFNEVSPLGTTRLGFDMVVSSKNIREVPETLRFCRKNNIWIAFSFYLPAGRSGNGNFNKSLMPSKEEMDKMRESVRQIDENEFGFKHYIWNNFATMPCVERIQIYGDGRVSPCPGNETIIGNVSVDSIRALNDKILKSFPGHNASCFNGNCLYRPSI